MLPFLLAILRKTQKIVPYHPERLVATGAINNGKLAPVDVIAKYHAFQDSFSDAVFCCPQSEPPLSPSYCVQILPLGINTDEITRKITKCIEAKGLFIPSLKYAIKRLPEIENDVRSTNYNNWNVLTDVISNLEKGLDPNRSPEQYLIMQMLKSAAACHHGNTDEAIKFNRNAYTFAKENGFARETFRLDIELLIELLDKEDFLSIRGLAATLEQQLKEVDDTDLFMRYYGTMGQVQAYGTLAKFEGFSNQNALFCFQNALQYAYKSDNEQHIAQDQNYIHLWHALFQPGEQTEIMAFQNALRHIQCNLADQPENQFRNLCYLERQRALAVYRHLLMYKKLPGAATSPILLTDSSDDWLEALLGKYNGAIAAAKNDHASARNMFDHALQVINLKHSMAIKAFIRMTICAEAYRSLQDESYLAEGLRSFELFPEIRNYATAARWEAYLRNPGENIFPGLEYWY
jgi:predicted negative regulator of RcsB-dependent stress response